MAFYEAGVARRRLGNGHPHVAPGYPGEPGFPLSAGAAGERCSSPARNYRISDVALAIAPGRSSCGPGPPDEELIALAADGKLSDPDVLDAQTRRMLADPRSESLATPVSRRSGLRLQDMDQVQPDAFWFPKLRPPARRRPCARETELLFDSLVREDRGLLRPVHGRLHVRQRAPGPALRPAERRRTGVPARRPDRRRPAAGAGGGPLFRPRAPSSCSPRWPTGRRRCCGASGVMEVVPRRGRRRRPARRPCPTSTRRRRSSTGGR